MPHSDDEQLLRDALAYEMGRANRLERELGALQGIVRMFCETVEAAEAHWNRSPGGLQVPFHGDFATSNPSSRSRLVWWARKLRESIHGPERS